MRAAVITRAQNNHRARVANILASGSTARADRSHEAAEALRSSTDSADQAENLRASNAATRAAQSERAEADTSRQQGAERGGAAMTRAGQFVVQNPRHHLQASVDAVAEAMAGVPAAAPWAKDIRAEWSKLSHAAATASDDAEAISALEQRAELLATRVGLAEDMAARQDRAIDSLVGFFAARGYQPHLLGSDADRRLVVEKDGYGLEWGVSSEDDETWSVASRPVAVGRQVVGGARMVASPDGTTRDELCTLAMAARQALDDASVGENEGLIEHEPFPATLPVIQVGKESPNSNAAAPQEERSRGM